MLKEEGIKVEMDDSPINPDTIIAKDKNKQWTPAVTGPTLKGYKETTKQPNKID